MKSLSLAIIYATSLACASYLQVNNQGWYSIAIFTIAIIQTTAIIASRDNKITFDFSETYHQTIKNPSTAPFDN